MSLRPTVRAFVLAMGTVLGANAAYGAPQKAEPNQQVPATPRANSGQGSGQSASGIQPPKMKDSATLQSQIAQALSNEPSLSSEHISVNVTDSEIQLSGTVASPKDKQTAERIAQSFDGNRKFTDNLLVTGQGGAVNPATNKGGTSSTPNQH